MESVSGSIKNQSNADSLLLYAVSHSPLMPAYSYTTWVWRKDEQYPCWKQKKFKKKRSNFSTMKQTKKSWSLQKIVTFFFFLRAWVLHVPLSKTCFCDWLRFVCEETSFKESTTSSAPPAPDTSGRPLGRLPSWGCLSRGWVWVGAGLNYPRATGQNQLDPDCQGTLSLIEGIRTGQRARKWPGQRDILTHLPSTLPHRLLHPWSLIALELQSFSPVTLREERCNLSPLFHSSTGTVFLLLTLTTWHTHTHARTTPSLLCCHTELMDYFSNWFQKCT